MTHLRAFFRAALCGAAAVVGGCTGFVGQMPDRTGPLEDLPSSPPALSGSRPTAEEPAAGPAGKGGDVPISGPVREGLVPLGGLRRLTSWEYDNALRDLIGDDSRPGGKAIPEEEGGLFGNEYFSQQPSTALIESAEVLAREAAGRLLADRSRRDTVVGCKPAGVSDALCLRRFLSGFGRKALRRPLSADELDRYQKALLAEAARSGDFYEAVRTAVEVFLQHPEYLYRVEIGAPVAGKPELFRLHDGELAARLSFLLWGTTPDERLLDLVDAGGLGTGAQVRGVATTMLNDRRGRALVQRFHGLWLGYENAALAPGLEQAMKAETAALVTRVIFDERRPWQDLFRVTQTFVPDTLAKHYGLPSPGSATPKWLDYGSTGRKGILSHGTFLSTGVQDGDIDLTDLVSTIERGKAVRERLLCQPVAPPPAAVQMMAMASASPAGPRECKEDALAAATGGTCQGCHALMNPIGLGLENYDGAGRYRATEPGKPTCAIAGAGEVVGIGTFKGPGELSDVLLGSGLVSECAVQQFYRFALGRSALDDIDRQMVARLMADLGARGDSDFRFDDLVLDLVSAEEFRFRRLPN
jgi:hypothetical protein